jgi:hypothetical protein
MPIACSMPMTMVRPSDNLTVRLHPVQVRMQQRLERAPITLDGRGIAPLMRRPPSWHCVAHRSLAGRPVALASSAGAVVLGGEPFGQSGDLGAGRRPSCPVRAGPGAGDQPVRSQRPGRERDQRGEDRGRPGRAGAADVPGAGRRRGAGARAVRRSWGLVVGRQDQSAAESDHDAVEQAPGHR